MHCEQQSHWEATGVQYYKNLHHPDTEMENLCPEKTTNISPPTKINLILPLTHRGVVFVENGKGLIVS